MSLSERIRTAMEAAGVSQAELARACNVSPPSVNGWLSGKAKFLRGENLLLVARALRVNQDWLATGRGSMSPGQPLALKVDGPMFADEDSPFVGDSMPVRVGEERDTIPIRMVKLKLRAGVSGFEDEPDMEEHGYLSVPRQVIDDLKLDPKHLLILRVRGQSMEPMMFEDDKVLVNTANRKPINKECFAINWNGDSVVKMLLNKGKEWYLHSINPDFDPVNVRSGQCSIVGHVVWQPGRTLTGRM